MLTCSICGKPLERNPISGTLTCFVHGREDSDDELERRIFARELKRREETPDL